MVVCSRSLERLAIQAPAAYSMRRATRALLCALALRSAAPKPPKRAKATGRNESYAVVLYGHGGYVAGALVLCCAGCLCASTRSPRAVWKASFRPRGATPREDEPLVPSEAGSARGAPTTYGGVEPD